VDGVPFFEWEIARRKWRTIIDTGFNGGLELPYALRPHVSAKPFGPASSVLAGGVVVEEDHFIVQVAFDGQLISTYANLRLMRKFC